MNKKIFLIITSNQFPTGDAGAVRLRSFCEILFCLGYCPVVVGMGETTKFKKEKRNTFEFVSLRYPSTTLISRILGRLLYKRHLKMIIKKEISGEICGILIDSGTRSVFRFVEKIALNKKIPLIYDSVEWYSEIEFKNGSKNKIYKHNNELNTKIIDEKYEVIAISSFLEDHFSNRGIKTVRIPVIMDVDQINPSRGQISTNEKIKIIYAGSIGNKDHIFEMINAIGLLEKDERAKLKFTIIGITKEQYENKYGKIDNSIIGESIIFKGRIDRTEVLEELKKSHFSFLLRPAEERYAKAGFPTKAVEALSCGIPMLCNCSSDLDMYLKDGYNSILIDECSVEACVTALRRVILCSNETINVMKSNARVTAENNFDWKIYIKKVQMLLNDYGEEAKKQWG